MKSISFSLKFIINDHATNQSQSLKIRSLPTAETPAPGTTTTTHQKQHHPILSSCFFQPTLLVSKPISLSKKKNKPLPFLSLYTGKNTKYKEKKKHGNSTHPLQNQTRVHTTQLSLSLSFFNGPAGPKFM